MKKGKKLPPPPEGYLSSGQCMINFRDQGYRHKKWEDVVSSSDVRKELEGLMEQVPEGHDMSKPFTVATKYGDVSVVMARLSGEDKPCIKWDIGKKYLIKKLRLSKPKIIKKPKPPEGYLSANEFVTNLREVGYMVSDKRIREDFKHLIEQAPEDCRDQFIPFRDTILGERVSVVMAWSSQGVEQPYVKWDGGKEYLVKKFGLEKYEERYGERRLFSPPEGYLSAHGCAQEFRRLEYRANENTIREKLEFLIGQAPKGHDISQPFTVGDVSVVMAGSSSGNIPFIKWKNGKEYLEKELKMAKKPEWIRTKPLWGYYNQQKANQVQHNPPGNAGIIDTQEDSGLEPKVSKKLTEGELIALKQRVVRQYSVLEVRKTEAPPKGYIAMPPTNDTRRYGFYRGDLDNYTRNRPTKEVFLEGEEAPIAQGDLLKIEKVGGGIKFYIHPALYAKIEGDYQARLAKEKDDGILAEPPEDYVSMPTKRHQVKYEFFKAALKEYGGDSPGKVIEDAEGRKIPPSKLFCKARGRGHLRTYLHPDLYAKVDEEYEASRKVLKPKKQEVHHVTSGGVNNAEFVDREEHKGAHKAASCGAKVPKKPVAKPEEPRYAAKVGKKSIKPGSEDFKPSDGDRSI